MPNTVTGVLKGYDQLLNLVLDEVEEQVQSTYMHTWATFPNPLIHSRLQFQSRARAHSASPCFAVPRLRCLAPLTG
jgi:small nuclear ribonucleoprotein (snRNP)-like protein